MRLASQASPTEWAAYAASNLTSSPPSPTSLKSVTTFLAELPGLDTLPRDNIVRQSLSLYVITYIGELARLTSHFEAKLTCIRTGILLLYFGVATFAYFFIFDHRSEFITSRTHLPSAHFLLAQ